MAFEIAVIKCVFNIFQTTIKIAGLSFSAAQTAGPFTTRNLYIYKRGENTLALFFGVFEFLLNFCDLFLSEGI